MAHDNRRRLARRNDDWSGRPRQLPGARAHSFITHAFEPSAAAIIHYGSRAQKTGSRPDSAYDFFVIVDDYEPAFTSFANVAKPRFTARSAMILSRFLPPSIVALAHSPA